MVRCHRGGYNDFIEKSMKIFGVIAEYNPLHKGHLWQLQQIRHQFQPDVLLVVMSGNFVQRGDLAIVDKWQRTEMALAAGVDLVVELPLYGSIQAANLFALAAVQILQALAVTDLVFGTESPDLDYYGTARKIRTLTTNSAAFSDYRNTYATQYNQIIEQNLSLDMTKPNQMLGLAYAQAAQTLKYPLTLHALPRTGAVDHDQAQLQGEFASASAIRQALLQQQPYQQALPASSEQILQTSRIISWKDFFPFLKYQLLTTNLKQLGQIYQMNEGLQYKLQQEILQVNNFPDFLYAIKSKRYTFARLRRVCLYTLLNLTTTQMQQMWQRPYLHVLGFNRVGQQYLHQIKKHAPWPLISNVNQTLGNRTGLMARAVQADQILNLLAFKEQNFGRHPIIWRK